MCVGSVVGGWGLCQPQAVRGQVGPARVFSLGVSSTLSSRNQPDAPAKRPASEVDGAANVAAARAAATAASSCAGSNRPASGKMLCGRRKPKGAGRVRGRSRVKARRGCTYSSSGSLETIGAGLGLDAAAVAGAALGPGTATPALALAAAAAAAAAAGLRLPWRMRSISCRIFWITSSLSGDVAASFCKHQSPPSPRHETTSRSGNTRGQGVG